LQTLINLKKEVIDIDLTNWLKTKTEVIWTSPIKDDDYAEYRDEDFLKKLKITDRIIYPLKEFWPKNGPQWDALGIDNQSVFIVEAKANLPEIVSSPCGAGTVSRSQIIDSFSELKEYLGINDTVDWTGKFYQYTNRLAHLYYLRVRNGINAYLLFIYFINDKTVNGPTSIEKWEGAIETMENYLGLGKKHKLKKYIREIFADVSTLV